MSPVIALQDVGLRYDQHTALHSLSVSVCAGESVALVGANGSGKSTLLRVMHGLLKPTQGQRLVRPALVLAMLFQRPFLLGMSVLSNLRLGLWLSGVPWRQTRQPALQALARVRLGDLAARPARSLSGGQQQRLALARAWATEPDVLLLDEPTASLDPHAKHEVEALMAEFVQARPVTLLFASHNLGQVKRLATRVLYLEGGRLLADLPVQDFFNPDVLQATSPAAYAFVKGELV